MSIDSVITLNAFCEDFAAAVSSKKQVDQVIIFTDGTFSTKTRRAYLASSLTQSMVDDIIKSGRQRGLFYSFADTDKFINSVKTKYKKQLLTSSDSSTTEILAKVNALSIEEVLALYNDVEKGRVLRSVSARKKDITYRPLLYIDIDLKDQYNIIKSNTQAAALVGDHLHSEDALKDWVVGEATQQEILEVLSQIIDMDTVINETDPNAIIYTGHGLHIVYVFPEKGGFPESVQAYSIFYQKFAKEVIDIIGGDIIYDSQCADISRNNKMPFTINAKTTPPKDVLPLHYTTLTKESSFLADVLVRVQAQELTKTKAKSSSGETVLNILGINGSLTKPRYGMPDIVSNSKIFRYIREYTRLSHILGLLGESTESISVSDSGFGTMLSPIRDESHPSFWFNDQMLLSKDWHDGSKQDYGMLIKYLLDKKKIQYGMFDRLPTTVYEAEYFLFFAAFAGSGDIQSGEATKKFREFFLTSPVRDGKKKPLDKESLEYFSTVLSSFEQLFFNATNQRLDGNEMLLSDSERIVKSIISQLPRVFYFPFNKHLTKDNEYQRNNLVAKLLAETILVEHRMVYTVRTAGHQLGTPEIFLIHNDMHVPYSEFFGNAQDVGLLDKEETDAYIGQKLTETGVPSRFLTPIVKQRLITAIRGLAAIESLLSKTTHTHSLGRDVEAAIKQIFRLPQSATFDDTILSHIGEATKRRFIRFKNTYVCYDSSNPYDIGTEIPDSPDFLYRGFVAKERHELVVINRRDIGYKKMRTPKFDEFINFMHEDENNFKRILAYFTSTMLYPPSGDSRALFLVGDGANGKSVLAGIFARLLGSDIMSEADMNSMTENSKEGAHVRAGTYTKLLNITPDASGENLGSVFKTLITGEPIQIRVMYKQPTDVYPKTSYIINTNRVPQLTGEATAFKRRVLYCQLTNTVQTKDIIRNLHDIIVEEEGPGIWYKLIKVVRINAISNKIFNRDRFLPPSHIKSMEQRLLSTNSLYEFIANYLHVDESNDPSVKLTAKAFIKAYNQFYIGGADSPMWISERSHLFEINQFIRMRIKELHKENLFTAKMLQQGLKYRSSTVGMPHVYINLPGKVIDRSFAYDTREQKV